MDDLQFAMSPPPRDASSTVERAPSVLRIGEYKLGETLGIGSFGKVKLAEHEVTGHKVAVKILNRKKIKNLKMDEKIRREIQILKLFRHPHIIRLYEVIETPTDIFLIMEYVSGGELFEYILTHGKLGEDQARRFFQQIIAGVEYCHHHRIVHRDLKPENLLLDAVTNHVKIADFGLSNIMRDGDFLKTSCGSPNYAAPEVISGQLYAGPEVDVWSCGVILYALLCARLPFDDDYIPNLFKKIKAGAYTVPTHVSPQCVSLIQSMLVVDPLKRASILDIRAHEWFRKQLPPYLGEPVGDAGDAVTQVDDNIAAEVAKKFGVDRERVKAELAKEATGGEKGDGANGGGGSRFTVAYHLVEDSRRDYAAEANQRAAASASVSRAPMLEARPPPLASSITPRPPGSSSASAGTQWELGVSSTRPAAELMRTLFSALQRCGYSWKRVAPYSLRCLGAGGTKLGVQLYRVRDGRYLIDVKHVDGPVYVFFDDAARLLLQLHRAFNVNGTTSAVSHGTPTPTANTSVNPAAPSNHVK